MIRSFLKLFYKPEEVIEKRLKSKAIGKHIALLLLANFGILYLSTTNDIPSSNFGFTVLSYLGILCMTIFLILLVTAVIKIIGIMVDGRARFMDLCIAIIYMLIPILICKSIYKVLDELGKRAFVNDADMGLNFEIMMKIIDYGIIIYFTYLFTKVIAVVQKIGFKKAIVNNIILIAVAFISIFDVIKVVSNDLDPERRAAERNNIEQAKSYMNE